MVCPPFVFSFYVKRVRSSSESVGLVGWLVGWLIGGASFIVSSSPPGVGEYWFASTHAAPTMKSAPRRGVGKRSRGALLEQWAVVSARSTDPYQAPELRPIMVTGRCYDVPNHSDGKEITTSIVHTLDEEEGVVHTLNSKYNLGTPSPDFVHWRMQQSAEKPYKYVNPLVKTVALERQDTQPLEGEFRGGDEEGCEGGKGSADELADELVDESANAERWLTEEDWNELHPGCPMSWMSEQQHAWWVERVKERAQLREEEARVGMRG